MTDPDRCRICARVIRNPEDHDGAAHDARAANMPLPSERRESF